MPPFWSITWLDTSVIASIAIELALEDAIRYLARLSDETRASDPQERTIATVDKPIIYASRALRVGFTVFFFFNFRTDPDVWILIPSQPATRTNRW